MNDVKIGFLFQFMVPLWEVGKHKHCRQIFDEDGGSQMFAECFYAETVVWRPFIGFTDQLCPDQGHMGGRYILDRSQVCPLQRIMGPKTHALPPAINLIYKLT